ncbi:prepilin-type N-terminal cleavage/methylation domain-containing protein [Corallococcus exiguus]|uniref:type IV pilus modification PilV family protein n=1 Tax=Corallococcus TaxID=83461 RepID=UPI000ECC7789|nr:MULTISPECIES: prepilin-type N-terminal cleavage/methylation domain-containing protein [Corallococcus]NNB93097.1 prepilin-type N-terminal cleavage/methylation domain-containing protein [Corallococcus exiguus]NNC02600.1 prepilin-type N-terminal cleavage/methylation domain-containing protein [Corallococcus exiguus]NPC45609.1 prepilin-type N-terminal cleavage/methylation domain-containing protein [Corallococcus exiguus]RKH87140.1 prepilin-type N-terminal cleavage/methylation domain-containing pr
MKQRASRGVTLLEVMATMAVMLLGVAAAMTVVSQTTQSNRRTLTANQAQIIAEQTLENILQVGCQGSVTCDTATSQTFDVYQTAEGFQRNTPPADTSVIARKYTVTVDVDNSKVPATIEDGKAGEPAITRNLVGTTAGTLVNVRVSVAWDEPGIRSDRQMVVLQSRMAP